MISDNALNDKWCSLFPAAEVRHLVAPVSDHCPFALSLDSSVNLKRANFRFEDMWLRDSSCLSFVTSRWSMCRELSPSSHMQDALVDWNKSRFGNAGKHLKSLTANLERVSSLPRTNDNIAEEDKFQNHRSEWCIREEILWKQRSRVLWLREGDNNTRFFHRRASVRRKQNNISFLTSQEGNILDDPVSIECEVISYFSILLYQG